MKKGFFLMALLPIAAVLFLILSQKRSVSEPPLPAPSQAVVRYPEPNLSLINQAFATKPVFAVAPSTRMAIVPHHLLAARQMAAMFEALPQTKTVIILSPDHFSQGKTSFTSPVNDLCEASKKGIDCTAGSLNQRELASLAQQIQILNRSDDPFTTEHGVYTLLPFLRQTQTRAQIIPIIIRPGTPRAELEALGDHLTNLLQEDPNLLLLSSIDFSHYQIQEVADFHDIFTQNAIERLDTDQALKSEIDSLESLFVTLSIAKRLSLEAQIQSHTNSLVLTRAILDRSSTSHLTVSFGRRSSTSSIESTKTEFWHQLPKIETEEDRLYKGFDRQTVFSDPTIPYFFGIVRKEGRIEVFPFPFDEGRQLLTRAERRKRVDRDQKTLIPWLKKYLMTDNINLIY